MVTEATNSKRGLEAKIVCESITHTGVYIATLQLRYWRFIHSEFMTHRVFSRNASSSRAVPVTRTIEEIRNNPAMPIYWGAEQRGMQAAEEIDDISIGHCRTQWLYARDTAVQVAENLVQAGVHKQIVNRILEPFTWIDVVVTSTKWDNFFRLRLSPEAQPEMRALAQKMHDALANRQPKTLSACKWHLPYVTDEERSAGKFSNKDLAMISAARCARVSYKNHDGTQCDPKRDLELAKKLQASGHMSPFEHQAYPLYTDRSRLDRIETLSGNFHVWAQFRKILEDKHPQLREF